MSPAPPQTGDLNPYTCGILILIVVADVMSPDEALKYPQAHYLLR